MQEAITRRTLRLEQAWQFHLGDISVPQGNDHTWTYMTAKACTARGPADPNFDHTVHYDPVAWRCVDLPHDWQVEQAFDPNANIDHGYKPRGVAWYRRKFRLKESDNGRFLALDFDGAATHCTVWVNGQLLHRNFCGYTGFRVDFSDVALFGDTLNTVVVRVDATDFEGWWYEGAGIYRHVWLVNADPLHVAQWGTFVRPVRQNDGSWDTRIATTIENAALEPRAFTLVSRIVGPDGSVKGEATREARVEALAQTDVTQSIPLSDPRLWSVEDPALYRLETVVMRGDRAVDEYRTAFGYRTIRFDPQRGFLLNDRPVKLMGTCNHQDHAGVGVAVPDALQEFRIRRLKDMGSNAYRCAHNPPAPELLDACDRLGMLVMDENRNFNSSPEGMRQLATMVRRDRNHPCVVLWSIFNEESIQGTERGRRIAEAMREAVHRMDDSRPVTAAMSGGFHEEQGVGRVVDVMGINYNLHAFEIYRAAHPDVPITASENNCALSTRGVYETSADTFYFDSYDGQKASWGQAARQTWQHIATRDWIAGYFVWTGFDYRGEPSPHKWPCINSHWGIMDTCGFAKDSFYLHKAFWSNEPVLHLLPHWNLQDREGQPVRVMVHTNCDEVELFLNGESQGRKPVDRFEQAEWSVPYAPGTLSAVGWRSGRQVAEARRDTTGEAAALRLEPDRTRLAADGEDAVPVTVCARDAQGRAVPTAGNRVTFRIEGPGRVLGVGNGDPTCHEPDKAEARSLFNGLCQVIVGAAGESGTIRLYAESPGLEPAVCELEAASAVSRPSVPAPDDYILIRRWRMSPVREERPDIHVRIADHDVNTWEQVELDGTPQTAYGSAGGYALYRTWQPLPRRLRDARVAVRFSAIAGTAEVAVNGVVAGRKQNPEPGPLECEVTDTAREELELTVLVHAPSGGGIPGTVKLVAV